MKIQKGIEKEKIWKGISIFLALLVFSLSFNVPLASAGYDNDVNINKLFKLPELLKINIKLQFPKFENVKAVSAPVETTAAVTEGIEAQEQLGCCLKTKEGEFCSDRGTKDACEEGFFFTGQLCSSRNECSLGTCIPDKGECQENKARFECIDSGGIFDARSINEVEACQEGACVIAGRICEVFQKKVCEEKAEEFGFRKEDVKFTPGLTNENEVKLLCRAEEKGTCILGGGICDYTTRADCSTKNGNFKTGIFPSESVECAVKEDCASVGCGKLPGDENKRFCFNDQGSQERLVQDCGYPAFVCKEESKAGKTESFCKSTACEFVLKDTDSEGRGGKKSLVSGTSMCYNFHSDEFGKSKGLEHEILHCAQGEVLVEGLGQDRERICIQKRNAAVMGQFLQADQTISFKGISNSPRRIRDALINKKYLYESSNSGKRHQG